MTRKQVFAMAVLAALFASLAGAQSCDTPNAPPEINPSHANKLALLVPRLYGACGLVLPNPNHEAHFYSTALRTFGSLDSTIGSQIGLLPLASPASGLLFTFDSALGVEIPSAQSLGPILSERGETLGRHRLFVAATYQYLQFNRLDGIDLNHVPSVFNHQEGTGPEGQPGKYEKDYITTDNSLNLHFNQFTVYSTFGLTDRIDVSAAVPFVMAHLSATSSAQIQRVVPEPDPSLGYIHYFDSNNQATSTSKAFGLSNSASGIGDVTFRVKGTIFRGERAAVALATDFRAPTGDAYNLLGTGGWGIRPFVIASYHTARFAPHANIGYEWNGKSVLAGDVVNNVKGRLPNVMPWTVGTDIAPAHRITLALDLLGTTVFAGPYIYRNTYTASNGATAPTIGQSLRTYSAVNGSTGVKINLVKRLLLTGNVIFRLNDVGLRANVIPLIGLSYVL